MQRIFLENKNFSEKKLFRILFFYHFGFWMISQEYLNESYEYIWEKSYRFSYIPMVWVLRQNILSVRV